MTHKIHGMKIGMLILMESDVEQAVEFYQKMGFPLTFHLKGKWAELNVGGVKLGLCPTDQQLPDRHTGIILEVVDVRACYEDLKACGVTFVREPFEAVHGVMASIKDPGGNIVDLYQPTPEKVKDLVEKVREKSGSVQDKRDEN